MCRSARATLRFDPTIASQREEGLWCEALSFANLQRCYFFFFFFLAPPFFLAVAFFLAGAFLAAFFFFLAGILFHPPPFGRDALIYIEREPRRL